MRQAIFFALSCALANAIPVLEVPENRLRTDGDNFSKRQSANGDAQLCRSNECSDCPMSLWSGTGFPECRIYSTDDFSDLTSADENGQESIYFDFPEPDPTCRWIVLSPAGRDSENCGSPAAVISGAACQRVTVKSTFMLQFCCGTGDCQAAATKHRRDVTNNLMAAGGASGGALYMVNTTSEGPPHDSSVSTKRKRADCDDFTVTEGPYSSIGAPQRISDNIACPTTGECQAQLTYEASQSRTISASVSVGDPFGIVSASVGVDFTEETSRSFGSVFNLDEGSSGYVVYVPYTQCYKGYFCSDDGNIVEVCYPEKNADGELLGEERGVITRA